MRPKSLTWPGLLASTGPPARARAADIGGLRAYRSAGCGERVRKPGVSVLALAFGSGHYGDERLDGVLRLIALDADGGELTLPD
jgi:hypothetical protein